MRKGAKKSPLTKEQLQRQMENERKGKIIVNQFFPALIDATISIDEAKMFLSAATSLIMEEVMQAMRERKFSEIRKRLVKKLCPDDERVIQVEKLLTIFDDETLFVSREIIEGMKAAIEQMIIGELQTRKLDTLKPDWKKYLTA